MTGDYYVSLYEATFGSNGGLLLEWIDYTTRGFSDLQGIVLNAAGQPVGSPVTIAPKPGLRLRSARLPDGRIVNAWEWYSAHQPSMAVWANVVSICQGSSADCHLPATATPTAGYGRRDCDTSSSSAVRNR